ncbi:uncharacterized protein [Dermacentor albipictus]|uniref:uncharacterized protein n=1 Tax=Dermacentor albipictus TaxID=60249 RepID=UPI0031FBE0F0
MKPTTLKTTEAKTAPSATRTPKKPPTTTKKPPTTTKKPPTTTKKPPTTPKVTTTTTRMLPELLCTVGDLAVLPAMYPYDGMCDYIFYTNVYIYNGQLTSTRVLRSFELFKAKTKKYSQTKGGVSFDIRYIESSTLAARRQALTGLSAYRIHHYGFLTMIAPTPTLEHWLRKAKDIFGQFKSIQGNDSSKKTVLALGTWGSGIRSVWQSFKKLVERATEASFKADIVIMISSTNLLYNTSSCSAVPPNVITSRNPMYPSLETYSELVKASYPYSNKLIEVGLSMEFAANVYKLKREPKTIDDVNLYEPCIWHSIGSITVACRKRSSYKIVFEPETVLTMQDGAKDVVYMHDSQRTFNVKVKYIMRLQRWPHFAWLVYNVHMADITNRCNYRGPFYLLGDMKNAFRG